MLSRFLARAFGLALLVAPTWVAGPAFAQQPANRIALVIGDGAYQTGALPTAANDAGLVAQTLTAAGFDVTGARDLDGDSLRRAFREFLDKSAAAGPGAIAFVYLSGYALQFDGENYFVPVDATLARDTDIPIQTIRLGDFAHALAALPLQARVMVVDGAYTDPAVPASEHIAPGLALVDPDPGSLMAFNAAPGTVAPTPSGTYGIYGQALAEMMREGGVPVAEVFDRVRLRVNETTRGAVVPWDADKLGTSFMFLEQAAGAPATNTAQQSFATMSQRPIREFPVEEAYSSAVARDNFTAYQDFLTAYPDSRYAKRVRALLAIRREALTWRQTVSRNSSAAYWSYMRRYPKGPHAFDARRRLAVLSAPLEPPPSFAPIEYDVPPPPQVEYQIVADPREYEVELDDVPPPPPPVYFLPPRPADFIDLPPPPPPRGPAFLPIPIPIPIPYSRSIEQPGFIALPRGIQGEYPQPRPFLRRSNGELAPQPIPQGDPRLQQQDEQRRNQQQQDQQRQRQEEQLRLQQDQQRQRQQNQLPLPNQDPRQQQDQQRQQQDQRARDDQQRQQQKLQQDQQRQQQQDQRTRDEQQRQQQKLQQDQQRQQQQQQQQDQRARQQQEQQQRQQQQQQQQDQRARQQQEQQQRQQQQQQQQDQRARQQQEQQQRQQQPRQDCGRPGQPPCR